MFIGPNVTFANDAFPRSKQYPDAFQETILKKGCSIGANATILGGTTIGEYALIGAGSVVTKNVLPHSLVVGNPAKQIAWVNANGEKLKLVDGVLCDSIGHIYKEIDGQLIVNK